MQFEKKLNELGRQKNELVNEKLSIERRHIERVKMESKKTELEDSVRNSDSAIAKIETQLRPLSDEIRESNLTRSRLIADRDKKARDFKQEIEKVKKFQNQVQSIQKQVNDYINSTNESTMTR
jgi:DNA repair exonuclease SbcCD ATPase subunit